MEPQLQDPTLPSELITKKAESLGIDRQTFQTVYPQIQQQFGGKLNDAQLSIALEDMVRDQRNQPANQVKETMNKQADLNRVIPWANEIDEAYGPKALEEYNVKIKEWEQKSGGRKALTDNLANIGDIAQPGGNNLYQQNQDFYKTQADRIVRDTIGLQGAKQKLLSDKTDAINKSNTSAQTGIGNLINNQGALLALNDLDPNSKNSEAARKFVKTFNLLPDLNVDELPAATINQYIKFVQDLQKSQLELKGKAAAINKDVATAAKDIEDAANKRNFRENPPPAGYVRTGAESYSPDPLATEAGKQKLANQQTIPGELLNIDQQLDKLTKIAVLLQKDEVLTGLPARIPGNASVGPYKVGNQQFDKMVAELKLRKAAELLKGQGSITEGERLLAAEASISRSNDPQVIREALLDSVKILRDNKKLLEGKLDKADSSAPSNKPASGSKKYNIRRVE